MKLFKLDSKSNLEEITLIDFNSKEAYIVDDNKAIYIWVGNDVSLTRQDNAVKKARDLNSNRDGAAKLLLMNQGKEYGAFLALKDQLREGIPKERRPELDLKKPEKVDAKEKIVQVEESKEPPKTKKGIETEEEPPVMGWLKQYVSIRSGKPPEEQVEEAKPLKKEPKKLEAPEEIKEPIKNEQIKQVEPPKEDELKEVSMEDIEEEETFEEQVNVAAYFISQNQLNYNELCWLLAEKTLILQKGYDNIKKEDIESKAEEVFNTSCTYDELCWLIGEVDIIMKKSMLEEQFY